MRKFVVDKTQGSIYLYKELKDPRSDVFMTPIEIFSTFVRKNHEFTNYKHDIDLIFSKTYYDLFFEISFGHINSEISFFTVYAGKKINLEATMVKDILNHGYILHNNFWLPVSVESIQEIKRLFKETHSISTRDAFRIVAARSEYNKTKPLDIKQMTFPQS